MTNEKVDAGGERRTEPVEGPRPVAQRPFNAEDLDVVIELIEAEADGLTPFDCCHFQGIFSMHPLDTKAIRDQVLYRLGVDL